MKLFVLRYSGLTINTVAAGFIVLASLTSGCSRFESKPVNSTVSNSNTPLSGNSGNVNINQPGNVDTNIYLPVNNTSPTNQAPPPVANSRPFNSASTSNLDRRTPSANSNTFTPSPKPKTSPSSSNMSVGEPYGGTTVVSTPRPPVAVKEEDEGPADPNRDNKPLPAPGSMPKTISGGVVNGKAIKFIQPEYPAAARAVRAAGAVNVQVLIDESGNVISAKAVSGHPLLRNAAEAAARATKFNGTVLSGQPVKVTGVLVYNFTP